MRLEVRLPVEWVRPEQPIERVGPSPAQQEHANRPVIIALRKAQRLQDAGHLVATLLDIVDDDKCGADWAPIGPLLLERMRGGQEACIPGLRHEQAELEGEAALAGT